MTVDPEPAVSGPATIAPSGAEPAKPKRSLFRRYQSMTAKTYEGKTGRDQFGLVYAVALYWVLGLWAFHTHSEIFRILVAYGAAFVAVYYIVRSGFWRRWAFWVEPKPEEKARSRRADLGKNVIQAIIAIVAMVSTFALLSAILRGFLDNASTVHHGNAAWNYAQAYLWNAIDAIPVLQINETIHWAMPQLFGTALGQASEIVFRLLVIGPGLTVITQYLQY